MGLFNPSHCAALDFVITMAAAMRMANDGISFSTDLEQYHFCHSITELYLLCQNPGSDYLRCSYQLLPTITAVAWSPKTPIDQREIHFLHRVSFKSARSYIKQFSGQLPINELYVEMEAEYPEYVPHLASISSPHLLPIVSIGCNGPQHARTPH